MSVQQYFSEVPAVVMALQELSEEKTLHELGEEPQTAVWQAAELLLRAYEVLAPLVELDLAKRALILPDPYEKASGLVVPGGGLVNAQ